MGPGSSTYPGHDDAGAQDPFAPLLPPLVERPEFWKREPRTRYVVLFCITLLTTTLAGAYLPEGATLWDLHRWLPTGLWYSLPVLAILGAHEFGHYFACVYYRVNASLPYFLPLPLPLFGTLGAVIRIRQPIPSKQALFDIGIAGPIAGFVVAVPVLVAGMAMSTVGPMPTDSMGLEFGEPPLLRLVAWFVLGEIPQDHTIYLHPTGMAAWFGMLATALNLFPIGQLDGGHITYAALPRYSTPITVIAAACVVFLAIFVSPSWSLWAVMTVAMVWFLGPRHPRVWDEEVPLSRGRVLLALFAVLMFLLCFTPALIVA